MADCLDEIFKQLRSNYGNGLPVGGINLAHI